MVSSGIRNKLITEQGAPIVLGSKIGSGGEGDVFQISGQPDLVAKIYTKNLEAPLQTLRKLKCLIRMADPELSSRAALPTSIVLDSNRTLVGFTMPKVQGWVDFGTLSNPSERLRKFNRVDFGFLLRASLNLARVLDLLHKKDVVVGDLNAQGIFVNPQGLVKLIDCDSFQVKEGTDHYLCTVAEPRHTPPEMMGKDFKRTIRTPNQDNFSLAVLIFESLFMGRHPFDGKDLRPGESKTPDRIRDGRFAYGTGAKQRQMVPPMHSLPLEAIPASIASMFESAFTKPHAHQSRPSAADWVAELRKFEQALVTCKSNPNHRHFSQLAKCPWCEIEKNVSVDYFFGLDVDPAISGKGAGFGDYKGDLGDLVKILTGEKPSFTKPAKLAEVNPSRVVETLGFEWEQAFLVHQQVEAQIPFLTYCSVIVVPTLLFLIYNQQVHFPSTNSAVAEILVIILLTKFTIGIAQKKKREQTSISNSRLQQSASRIRTEYSRLKTALDTIDSQINQFSQKSTNYGLTSSWVKPDLKHLFANRAQLLYEISAIKTELIATQRELTLLKTQPSRGLRKLVNKVVNIDGFQISALHSKCKNLETSIRSKENIINSQPKLFSKHRDELIQLEKSTRSLRSKGQLRLQELNEQKVQCEADVRYLSSWMARHPSFR